MDIFLFDQPIMGVTINNVMLNPAFRKLLIAVIACAFALPFAIMLYRGKPFLHVLRISILTAFFTGGFLYALHADIGWARWVIADYNALSGKTEDEKLLTMEKAFYEFVLRSRSVLDSDYAMLNDNSGNYFTRRYEYFMLPLRKRSDAPYIVVVGDREAKYDPTTNTLTRKDFILKNVEPVMLFLNNAYILRKP